MDERTITLQDKISTIERELVLWKSCLGGFPTDEVRDRQVAILEDVLADLRAIEKPYEGNPRIRLAWRWSAEQMRERAAQTVQQQIRIIGARGGSSISEALECAEAAIRALPVE